MAKRTTSRRKRQRPGDTVAHHSGDDENENTTVENGETSGRRRVTKRRQASKGVDYSETRQQRRRRTKKDDDDDNEEKKEEEMPARKKTRRRKTLSQDPDARRRVMKDLEELRAEVAETKVAREEKEKRKPTVEEVERLWQGWKNVFFVGTEWSNYDLIFNTVQWDFDHLKEELFEGSMRGKKVFLFGCTEPQTIGNDIYFIPVIVAVMGDIPPPRKLGIKSVQMEKEEIIPMEEMKMGWVPMDVRLGRGVSTGTEDDTEHRIFMLHCNTRRATLGRMKEEEIRKYEYCLPYFLRPRDALKGDDYPTDVTGMCTIDGRGVSFDFDWEMDDLDEYVDELCESHEIKEDSDKKTLREAIRDAVRAAKQSIKEDKAKKKAEIEAIPKEQQEAMNEAQFFKFYPQNDDPDLEAHNLKSPFINRYYGRATKLF